MMRRTIVAAGLVTLGLVLLGCRAPVTEDTAEEEAPALVEAIDGQEGLHRITLTERAAERLGIETAEVTASADGGRTQLPYSAIIYDAGGTAWAYVVDGQPLVFVRQPIAIDDVVVDQAGDYALLTAGPEPGTSVVTVGVAELFGAEFSVGH
jgi:vacuolar-type H+-ATPase subunit F/Vma7